MVFTQDKILSQMGLKIFQRALEQVFSSSVGAIQDPACERGIKVYNDYQFLRTTGKGT